MGKEAIYVGRRYGDFVKLHKRLRTELPGKVIPSLPRKNKNSSTSFFPYIYDDNESVSSASIQDPGNADESRSARLLTPGGHHGHGRSRSRSSIASFVSGSRPSSRPSSGTRTAETSRDTVLFREEQRVSLRAFLRTLLQNKRIAESKAIAEFLTSDPIVLNEEDLSDLDARRQLDAARIEEQSRFYEVARQRAAELDVYMERFRRDIVEESEFRGRAGP